MKASENGLASKPLIKVPMDEEPQVIEDKYTFEEDAKVLDPMEALPTEDWESWTYEQCTLMLKRQSKHLNALLRLSSILNFKYNKPEEAQLKLNEVIK